MFANLLWVWKQNWPPLNLTFKFTQSLKSPNKYIFLLVPNSVSVGACAPSMPHPAHPHSKLGTHGHTPGFQPGRPGAVAPFLILLLLAPQATRTLSHPEVLPCEQVSGRRSAAYMHQGGPPSPGPLWSTCFSASWDGVVALPRHSAAHSVLVLATPATVPFLQHPHVPERLFLLMWLKENSQIAA